MCVGGGGCLWVWVCERHRLSNCVRETVREADRETERKHRGGEMVPEEDGRGSHSDPDSYCGNRLHSVVNHVGWLCPS